LLHPVVIFCNKNKRKVLGNSNFKAYYLHLDFMEMVRVLETSHKTIKDYWWSSDILKSINNINSVWEVMSEKYLKGMWDKLL